MLVNVASPRAGRPRQALTTPAGDDTIWTWPQGEKAFGRMSRAPPGIYDSYLGGKDTYPADRAAAERIIAMMPDGVVRPSAVQNRKFLMRVVRHLAADLGVRQFLDIGAGLPTMDSVHHVAQAAAPDSR